MILLWVSRVIAVSYSGEIFRFDTDARIAALGGVQVALESWAGMYNPACLAFQNFAGISLSHSSLFHSSIFKEYIGFQNGKMKIFPYSFAFMYVGAGGISITSLPDTTLPPSATNRPYKLKDESYKLFAGFGSISKAFYTNISFGATLKLAYQDMYRIKGYSAGLDFGAFYSLSDWIRLGLKIENLIPVLTYWSSGEYELGYVGVYPGLSFFVPVPQVHSELVFVSTAEYLVEENVLSLHMGGEFLLKKHFAIRAGYDRESLTLGGGLNFSRYSLSILLKQHPELKNSYNISIGIKL